MSKMSMNDVAEIFTAVEVKEQEVQRFRRIIQTGRHFLYPVSLWYQGGIAGSPVGSTHHVQCFDLISL